MTLAGLYCYHPDHVELATWAIRFESSKETLLACDLHQRARQGQLWSPQARPLAGTKMPHEAKPLTSRRSRKVGGRTYTVELVIGWEDPQ